MAALTSRNGDGRTWPLRMIRICPACSTTYQSSDPGVGAAKVDAVNDVAATGAIQSGGTVGATAMHGPASPAGGSCDRAASPAASAASIVSVLASASAPVSGPSSVLGEASASTLVSEVSAPASVLVTASMSMSAPASMLASVVGEAFASTLVSVPDVASPRVESMPLST